MIDARAVSCPNPQCREGELGIEAINNAVVIMLVIETLALRHAASSRKCVRGEPMPPELHIPGKSEIVALIPPERHTPANPFASRTGESRERTLSVAWRALDRLRGG